MSDLYEKLEEEFRKAYSDYNDSVSKLGMAFGKESCLYVLKFCLENKPLKVVDLGSGISSYVLRLYQYHSDDDVIVYSIDDHKGWLGRAKDFCSGYNLNTDNFLHGIDKIDDEKGDFDLVIHDYGSMGTRTNNIVNAFDLTKVGGTVIYDDCHKLGYYNIVKNKMKDLSQEVIELDETEENSEEARKYYAGSNYFDLPKRRFCVKVVKEEQ